MPPREETLAAIRDILAATSASSTDGALLVEDHYDNEIHNGRVFRGGVSDIDLDNTDVLAIGFRTPLGSVEHTGVTARVYSSGATTYEILEGATVTPGTGSVVPLYNRDRNSANECHVLDSSTDPATAGRATKNPAITDDGTVINTEYLGIGKQKQAGETRNALEFLLKFDTQYVFRVTARADNNQVHIICNLFHHG